MKIQYLEMNLFYATRYGVLTFSAILNKMIRDNSIVLSV